VLKLNNTAFASFSFIFDYELYVIKVRNVFVLFEWV
jgi:hypothetical protein